MAITIKADLDKVAQTVTQCWDDWTHARRKKERIWQECVMNYLCEVDETKYQGWPWRSKVADTLSQETGDTVASSLINGLFPLNEKYLDIAGNDEASADRAPKMLGYLEAQLKRANFIESVRPWAKQLSVIGNAPYLGRFDVLSKPNKRRVVTREVRTGKPSYGVQQVSGIKTTSFLSLDAFDVAFDPDCLSPNDSPMIWRCVMSKARVLALPNLTNLAQLEDVDGGAPSQPSDSLKTQRKRAFGVTKPDAGQEESDPNEIEILCYFGDLEIDGELFENQRLVIGNRTVVLRAEPEPFWAGRPIGWAGYDQLWMTGLEKGPLEPIRGVQSLIDTFQNQKADILNLIINGAFAYVNDGIIDPDNLWLRPGGFIEVGSLDNLKPLQPSSNVALTYQELGTLREQAERSSGKSRFDMGIAPGGRRTAYEANLIRGGGSSRSNDILRHLANGPMESYLSWALGTLQQMKWDSGEIENDILAGDYRVNFLGADLTTLRQFQVQNLMMAIQVMAQAPPEMTAWVNKQHVWRELFKALTMDDEKAINTPEEAQKELQAITQREQQRQPPDPMQSPGSGPGGQDADLMTLLQGGAAA